jgi:hypothetical protein
VNVTVFGVHSGCDVQPLTAGELLPPAPGGQIFSVFAEIEEMFAFSALWIAAIRKKAGLRRLIPRSCERDSNAIDQGDSAACGSMLRAV